MRRCCPRWPAMWRSSRRDGGDGIGEGQVLEPSLRAKRSNPFLHVKKEWIASSQELLAMTVVHPDTASRSRGTLRPSFAGNLRPRKSERAGTAGCELHPPH